MEVLTLDSSPRPVKLYCKSLQPILTPSFKAQFDPQAFFLLSVTRDSSSSRRARVWHRRLTQDDLEHRRLSRVVGSLTDSSSKPRGPEKGRAHVLSGYKGLWFLKLIKICRWCSSNIPSNAIVSRMLHFTTNTVAVLDFFYSSSSIFVCTRHLKCWQADCTLTFLSQLYLHVPEAGRLLSKYSPLAEVEQSVPESSHLVGFKEETAVTKTRILQFLPKHLPLNAEQNNVFHTGF